MGTISSTLDRPPRTAAVIGTEDEALTVASTIAGIFDISASGSGATRSAEERLDLLSRSGLLGVSVLTEHGGIDVSNTVLAEICAVAAAQSATLGDILAAHFVALEQVRSYGTEGQRNTAFAAALAGARFTRANARRNGEDTDALPLAASGLAWRLSGDAHCTPCARHADWMLVPTRNDGGKLAGLLLPTRVEGLRYIANSCEPASGVPQVAEHVLFKDVLVDGDALMHPLGTAQLAVPYSLELLLEAARQSGAGRRALLRLLDKEDPDLLELGLASARLGAAEAMIAEAGRAIDAAQIGLAEQHRTNAFLSAAAALAVAQEISRDIQASAGRSSDDMAKTADLSPALAAVLRESGRLRHEAHRQPPDEQD
jgi:hypothetical protein